MINSETMLEFIAQRRRELDIMERLTRERLAAIDTERSALDVAEDAVRAQSETQRPRHLMTIQQAALRVLEGHADGLSTADITTLITPLIGTIVHRTSVAPQLSRLKHDGAVTLDGGVWRLRRRDQRDDAA